MIVEVVGGTDEGKCEHCGGTIELVGGYVICSVCDHEFDFRPLPPRPTEFVPGLIRPPIAPPLAEEESSGAHSAPAEQCEWSETEDGQWETECNRLFEFNEGGPEENRLVFCFNCGKSVHSVRWAPKEDDASGASGG